jgi:hypothetical protein
MIDVSTDAYYARMAIVEAVGQIAGEYTRPSVIWKPALSREGTMWCALFGENLAEGVAGFGPTPEEAMRDFDRQWMTAKTPAAARALAEKGMPREEAPTAPASASASWPEPPLTDDVEEHFQHVAPDEADHRPGGDHE